MTKAESKLREKIINILEEYYYGVATTRKEAFRIVADQILEEVRKSLPKIGLKYDGSLDKYTECSHKIENTLSDDCIHCDFAWCIERIKFLEKCIEDMERKLK